MKRNYWRLAEVPGVARGKCNPIVTHVWKISIGPENMWKILNSWSRRWEAPPCKPIVDSLEKWMIFDRNKAQNKKINSLGSHFLNPVWPRKLRRQNVIRTVRMMLSSQFLRRKGSRQIFVPLRLFSDKRSVLLWSNGWPTAFQTWETVP